MVQGQEMVDEIDYLGAKEAPGQEIVDEIDYLRAKEAPGQEKVDEIDYLLYFFDWRAGVTRLLE